MPKPKKTAKDASEEGKEKDEAAAEAMKKEDEEAKADADDAKKDTPEEVAKPKAGDDDDAAAKDESELKEEDKDEKDVKEEDKDGDGDTEMKEAEEEGKKKKRKKSPAKEPKEPAVKRERRERKSANTFTPDDFTHEKKTVKAKTGRGVPLGELEIVKESIESAPMSSPYLQQLHRFLYTMRGKPAKKEMKANILKFSGYLPPLDKSLDEEAQAAVDEEEEVR